MYWFHSIIKIIFHQDRKRKTKYEHFGITQWMRQHFDYIISALPVFFMSVYELCFHDSVISPWFLS